MLVDDATVPMEVVVSRHFFVALVVSVNRLVVGSSPTRGGAIPTGGQFTFARHRPFFEMTLVRAKTKIGLRNLSYNLSRYALLKRNG